VHLLLWRDEQLREREALSSRIDQRRRKTDAPPPWRDKQLRERGPQLSDRPETKEDRRSSSLEGQTAERERPAALGSTRDEGRQTLLLPGGTNG
jgi:hypothetical protein